MSESEEKEKGQSGHRAELRCSKLKCERNMMTPPTEGLNFTSFALLHYQLKMAFNIFPAVA